MFPHGNPLATYSPALLERARPASIFGNWAGALGLYAPRIPQRRNRGSGRSGSVGTSPVAGSPLGGTAVPRKRARWRPRSFRAISSPDRVGGSSVIADLARTGPLPSCLCRGRIYAAIRMSGGRRIPGIACSSAMLRSSGSSWPATRDRLQRGRCVWRAVSTWRLRRWNSRIEARTHTTKRPGLARLAVVTGGKPRAFQTISTAWRAGAAR